MSKSDNENYIDVDLESVVDDTEDQRVTIVMTDHGKGRVWVDDVEIKNIRKIRFTSGSGERNELTLALLPTVVDVTTMASVSREFCSLEGLQDPQESEDGEAG